jgi:hypothetical protein
MLTLMQDSSVSFLANNNDDQADSPFNVLIAYEDFETGKHAKKTYDLLLGKLGWECQTNLWRFDILGMAKPRKEATKDARLADAIIISSHGNELPAQVQSWIESWLMEVKSTLALVAVFDQPHTRTLAARAYLAEAARRADLEFFAYPEELVRKNNPREQFRFPPSFDLQSRSLTALWGATPIQPVGRWSVTEKLPIMRR